MLWACTKKINIYSFHCLTVLIAALIIGGCASAPPLPPPPAQPHFNDYLIIPGKRIGSIAIGMTGKQLLDVMGSPQGTVRFADAASYNYPNYPGNFSVMVDDATQQVWRVTVNDANYSTQEGLSVGQTELEMRAKLGNPDSRIDFQNDQAPYYRNCYKNGLSVYIDWKGKIVGFSIFNPGGACS